MRDNIKSSAHACVEEIISSKPPKGGYVYPRHDTSSSHILTADSEDESDFAQVVSKKMIHSANMKADRSASFPICDKVLFENMDC